MQKHLGRQFAVVAAMLLGVTAAGVGPASGQRGGDATSVGNPSGGGSTAPIERSTTKRPTPVQPPVGGTYDLVPMFQVEALGFTAIDESGVDVLGSDEIWAMWSSQGKVAATQVFDDVDTGESRSFHVYQSCIYPMAIDVGIDGRNGDGWTCVDGGAPGPVEFEVEFYEDDVDTPLPPSCFSLYPADKFGPECADDWLGTARHSMSTADLLAVLPTPGSTKTYRSVAHGCDPDVICANGVFGAVYEIEFRITRMADKRVERSVISR